MARVAVLAFADFDADVAFDADTAPIAFLHAARCAARVAVRRARAAASSFFHSASGTYRHFVFVVFDFAEVEWLAYT